MMTRIKILLNFPKVLLVFILVHSLILPVVNASKNDTCADTVSYLCPNSQGNEEDTHLVGDCLDCDGFLNTDESHNLCFQRKLFNDHNTSTDPEEHYHYLHFDIIGAFVWFCTAGIATACGVGGGGIYVPLGILLLRFASKPASGLSQASIFGSSLGGLILNIHNQHPNTKIKDSHNTFDKDGRIVTMDPTLNPSDIQAQESNYLQKGHHFYTRPLIDYDMALFLAPMEMAGAVLGVLIQKILPNWLFLTLAGCILGYTCYKSFTKFRSAYKVDKENVRLRRQAEQQGTNEQSTTDILSPPQKSEVQEESPGEIIVDLGKGDTETQVQEKGTDSSNVKDHYDSEINDNDMLPIELEDTETLQTRKKYLEEDARQYPVEKLLYFIILWIGLTLLTFFKGGKKVDSLIGITCQDATYPILIVLQFIWTIGYALVFAVKLMQKQQARVLVNYPFLPQDVLWDIKKLRLYGLITFLAGIVAGLIGIGGGMVLGPLMIVMGIHPRVSSATTATMIVLTSSSVAVMFVTSGLVPWSYALFFFCVCLCGAYFGKMHIDSYVKKTGMASILIGILSSIIGFATIGCFVIVIYTLDKNSWCFDGLKKFCDA